ncbi:hypothetical protein DICVIV_05769 [Dictyocaulus viviparus]|uniref:MADF domain-containing protein n=1 Tax=Dictyocaulus viviparus TaxID=29172 RepID=A0A0D8XWJ0_DICVI|nr:hypothetical protein DICVIV_05769 [Dictyocaulus viviparus]
METSDYECVSTATNRSTSFTVPQHNKVVVNSTTCPFNEIEDTFYRRMKQYELIVYNLELMKLMVLTITDVVPGEEWDARSKVALIQCYRDEPNLWSGAVVFRSDAEKRQYHIEAWKRITKRMVDMGYTFELSQLKKKMKQLRDQFIRENKMFEDHSSKWQFYEEMRFLNQNEEFSSGNSMSFVDLSLQKQSSNYCQQLGIADIITNKIEDTRRSNVPDSAEISSFDIEVKRESVGYIPHHNSIASNEGSSVVASSNDVGLSDAVMDELLRLVLSRKDIILNDSNDDKIKEQAWNYIYEFLRGTTNVIPTVDQLKEALRKKLSHISDIVSKNTKTDIFSAYGFARYIQNIVNKCLPEEQFSVRERELGSYILRKSFELEYSFTNDETLPPTIKRPRVTNCSTENHCTANSHPETSAGTCKKTPANDMNQSGCCCCNISNECFRNCLLEMIQAQNAYFKAVADAQKEQVRILATLGDVLDRVTVNLQPLIDLNK